MAKVYCEVHNQEYNMEELEQEFGTVEHVSKTLYLTQQATVGNYGDGVAYFADAIDEDGECYRVIWETTEAWDLAQEYEDLSYARRYHDTVSDEVRERYEELDAMAHVDVCDESNACDWERPLSIRRY